MKIVTTSSLGFPRMGPNRELKFALEKYWTGKISQGDLLQMARSVEESAWTLQQQAGIGKVTIGDHYLYDFVLMMTESLGIVAKRFSHLEPGLDRLFAMARGIDGAPALSKLQNRIISLYTSKLLVSQFDVSYSPGMKKWITSNYHYMVPEFDETSKLAPDFSRFLDDCKRGLAFLGADRAIPVLLGPVSFVHLAKISGNSISKQLILSNLLPVYTSLLEELVGLGIQEVQIHEPVLVFNDASIIPLLQSVYPAMFVASKDLTINMVSFMDDVGDEIYQWLMSSDNGIRVVSLDFTRGDTLGLIKKYGVPETKILGVGLVDARNIWKVNPDDVIPVLSYLAENCAEFRVQPSGSLQYVPWTLGREEKLRAGNHLALPALAFATEKLDEIVLLANVCTQGNQDLLSGHNQSWKNFFKAQLDLQNNDISDRLKRLEAGDFCRQQEYTARRKQQLKGLPPLPTTTIGSFPQTAAIRRARANWKKGNLSDAEYQAAMDLQIAYCIGVQEALGLDVLVHGEPERTDMVEFFGEQMDGILFTQHGWVQSFGSRCVRPPIFWSDITRPRPMTIREFKVAQALTDKPVKGMLTGPITILNWSFPRVDISRKEQAFQLSLCIRDEIRDLEEAGCKVIQVDEPALREGMPFRAAEKDEYLRWAVDAFRLATAGAISETQIHTHMCYCEFQDCMHGTFSLVIVRRLDVHLLTVWSL